jgi:exopolysaccharide biosynthesis polyprenyl glycosylphosphotransferase
LAIYSGRNDQLRAQELAEEGIAKYALNTTPQKRAAHDAAYEYQPGQVPPLDDLLAGKTPRPSRLRVSGPHGLPVQIAYVLIDCAMVGLVGALVFHLESGMPRSWGAASRILEQLTHETYFAVIFAYGLLVVMSCASQDLYRTPRDRDILEETLMVSKAVSLATAVLVLLVFAFGAQGITRIFVLSLAGFTAATLSGWRYLKRRVILTRTLRGIGITRALIVGAGKTGRELASFLEANPTLGYKVYGFLDAQSSSDPLILGRISEMQRVVTEQFIDEIFLTPPIDREVVKQLVLVARRLRLRLKVVPDLYDGIGWRAPVHVVGGFPVMQLNENPIPGLGVAVKRILDVVIATSALVLTAPLLALLAAIVRLDSPGRAFYPAVRVGYKGREFCCWKLRTMYVGADSAKEALRKANERTGPWFKMKNDPRITKVGRWLRKFSLDELPQLWNVLRGEMSLVGPRPHPVDDFNHYKPEHLRRLDVKPGLTGLWQVTARRDPYFETNLALDLDYIENWSLRLDLEILFRSLAEVFRGTGE